MEKNKDIISEEEYTRQMIKSASTSPEEDSPGDSESDTETEFEMGLDYEPPIQLADDGGGAEDVLPSVDKIPEKARAVSSDLPAHRLDKDSESDTH